MDKREAGLDEGLRRVMKEGRIHHGYIFQGSENVDKPKQAKAVAKALLCKEEPGAGCGVCNTCRAIDEEEYPDMTVVRAETASDGGKVRSVRDKAIEELINRLMRKPVVGDRNIAIICDGQTMTKRAANRLLKTLEEPPEGTVIMILTDNAEEMLPTIRSRCVLFSFEEDEEVKKTEVFDRAAELADGAIGGLPYYRLKDIIESAAGDKAEAGRFLDCMELHIRDRLTGGHMTDADFARKALEIIEETRKNIKLNGNIKYAMKYMTIKLGGN